jgi:hypothetical protein
MVTWDVRKVLGYPPDSALRIQAKVDSSVLVFSLVSPYVTVVPLMRQPSQVQNALMERFFRWHEEVSKRCIFLRIFKHDSYMPKKVKIQPSHLTTTEGKTAKIAGKSMRISPSFWTKGCQPLSVKWRQLGVRILGEDFAGP